MNRRELIRNGVATLLSATVLEACAPAPIAAPPTPPPSAASAGGPFPMYVPLSGGPKPDFHDTDARYTDGYNHYPASPVKSWTRSAPGSGSTISVFTNPFGPAPTARDQNSTWHEVEKQLNATVQMNIVPNADYYTKLATVMAGNDLPDVIHLQLGYASAPNLPDFLKSKCADLTPFLGGDAAKNYPNLASIPTYSWKNSISAIDGKLYLIPLHRPLPGTGAASHSGYFFKNIDVWDKVVGPGYVPKNADDLKRVLQTLNRPNDNYWAIGDQVGDDNAGLPGYAQMFRAPHGWRLETSGHLTHKYETEEYKTAVGFVRDLWAAGLFHPDSNGSGGTTTDFAANKFATGVFGYGNGWVQMWRTGLQANPPVKFAIIPPFAHDGNAPINYLTGGFLSLQALKQGPPDRIQEVLRILDWLAAPFGSQEDLLLTYGLKDQDYTLDANGSPLSTPTGKASASAIPWLYVAQHPYVNYQADLPGFAQTFSDAEHLTIPTGIYDPTLGYYSATNYGKGVAANQTAFDGMNDIILGRQPMSAYDDVVKTWVGTAGDQIRNEYMTAMAAAK